MSKNYQKYLDKAKNDEEIIKKADKLDREKLSDIPYRSVNKKLMKSITDIVDQ